MKTQLVLAAVALVVSAGLVACGTTGSNAMKNEAQLTPAEIASKVLTEGLGQQDEAVIREYVREDYVQHSAMAAEGRAGLLAFVQATPGVGVEIHRTLTDGDRVALHVTYTMPDGARLVAFDVFRVEGGQLAEHWDALQAEVTAADSASGNSMTDGPTEVVDREQTEANRALVVGFVRDVLTGGQFDRITAFVSPETYVQHNPAVDNGLDGLNAFVGGLQAQGVAFGYTRSPLVVAEGNFVLVGSEGFFGPVEAKPFGVFYDLFRVEGGKIVEHWDVIPSPAPDPTQLRHQNGLF